jgi:hypothetical protein
VETSATIPEAFRGKWSDSVETCAMTMDDTSVMRVTGAAITFYEGQATVKSVKLLSADSIEVEANWSGEGRTWSATNRLTLSRSGQAITLTGYGRNGKTSSVRCS